MEGIIYKIQPYQETSRLLFTYTPKGKVTLLAKGAQKLTQKTRVIGQFLTRVSFDITPNKTFMIFKNPQVINDYKKIKDDFVKTKYAALALEIVDKFMTELEDHQKVYDELVLVLDQEEIHKSVLSFSLKMLKILGYGIDLDADGRVVKGISVEKGGITYENEGYIVDLDTKDAILLLKLYYLPYNEHSDVSDESIHRIEIFISRYYAYHLHTILKNLT